ncbi:hypothetical protein [Haloplasma contractile]|nr:hypothetical protein [Haloplasma contractile]
MGKLKIHQVSILQKKIDIDTEGIDMMKKLDITIYKVDIIIR